MSHIFRLRILGSTLVLALALHGLTVAHASDLTAAPGRESGAVVRVPRLWTVSALAVAAATSFDAYSSYGKYEANPLLRSGAGTFGTRGSLLKLGITGASLGLQYAFRRHPGLLKRAAILNFVQAGVYTGVAAHNLGVSGPRR